MQFTYVYVCVCECKLREIIVRKLRYLDVIQMHSIQSDYPSGKRRWN